VLDLRANAGSQSRLRSDPRAHQAQQQPPSPRLGASPCRTSPAQPVQGMGPLGHGGDGMARNNGGDGKKLMTAEVDSAPAPPPPPPSAATSVAAFGAATAQTLLPPGTYQPPLLAVVPWDVMQHLPAQQQHGEPRHFNSQGDHVNSRGRPYMKPPHAGPRGSNGGTHASWRKREKEKAKRAVARAKRTAAPAATAPQAQE
jgi:hypothetical protein